MLTSKTAIGVSAALPHVKDIEVLICGGGTVDNVVGNIYLSIILTARKFYCESLARVIFRPNNVPCDICFYDICTVPIDYRRGVLTRYSVGVYERTAGYGQVQIGVVRAVQMDQLALC